MQMKNVALTTLSLALVAGLAVAQQRAQTPPPRPSPPSPPPLTQEKAFFYFLAIYGTPGDAVKRYGSYFDAGNYCRAMADEFERGRYTESIRARIAAEVGKIDFGDKFIATGEAMLAEYSFASHSFPIVRVPQFGWCIDAGRSFFGNCTGSVLHVDVFRREDAINATDFNWSLPMSEGEGSTFVKSRTSAQSGGVDRRVTARITYSVLNKKGRLEESWHGQAAEFIPFIYSVEVYGNDSLTKKLGVVPKINSLTPGNPEEMRAAEERVKEEAPEKLRALLTTRPVLAGTLFQGAKITLRVMSFDSGTGSVSAEVDFTGDVRSGTVYDPPLVKTLKGHSSRAVGNVSGDTLNLTATWTEVSFLGHKTTEGIHFKLRFNGPARTLVGPWCNGTKECTDGTASFDLK
jgi:hypothetical protein